MVTVCLQAVLDGEGPPPKVWYCTEARYCNWTNNPFLVSKTWWRDEYGAALSVSAAPASRCAGVTVWLGLPLVARSRHCDVFADFKLYALCFHWVRSQVPDDRLMTLEPFMDSVEGAWKARPWVVALGMGLFKHADANKFSW